MLIAHRDHALVRLVRERCPKDLRIGVASSVADARRQVGRARWLRAATVALRLPDGDGIALALELRARAPALHVLIMTRRLSRELANRLYAIGLGYAVAPAQLTCMDAFFGRAREARMPANGRALCAVPPPATLDEWMAFVAASPVLQGITFTRRELEVLALAVAGYDQKEIAQELGVQPDTVKGPFAALKAKTRVTPVRELARLVRCGETLPQWRDVGS